MIYHYKPAPIAWEGFGQIYKLLPMNISYLHRSELDHHHAQSGPIRDQQGGNCGPMEGSGAVYLLTLVDLVPGYRPQDGCGDHGRTVDDRQIPVDAR
jgi:hypothetical protein